MAIRYCAVNVVVVIFDVVQLHFHDSTNAAMCHAMLVWRAMTLPTTWQGVKFSLGQTTALRLFWSLEKLTHPSPSTIFRRGSGDLFMKTELSASSFLMAETVDSHRVCKNYIGNLLIDKVYLGKSLENCAGILTSNSPLQIWICDGTKQFSEIPY